MEKNPKNNQRGIGDNSVDQSFGEWASASLDDAINYIVRLIRKNKRLEHQLNESINARNNLKRGIALSEAKKINDSISKDAKVFVSLVAQQKESYKTEANVKKAQDYGYHRTIRFDNGERGHVNSQLTDTVLEHGLNSFRNYMKDVKAGKKYCRGGDYNSS